MTVYHNHNHHHHHHHHRGSDNVPEGDDICVTVMVNYIAQWGNPLNTENHCIEDLAVGSQLDKKASEVVLNVVLIGKNTYAEYRKSRLHKISVKLVTLVEF